MRLSPPYHVFHGEETGAETTAPKLGEPMQPKTNTVGIQFAALGAGAVSATVQVKGRIDDQAPLENIGSPVTMSGTAAEGSPVSTSIEVHTVAAKLYADLTACSVISFRAVAWEAGR